MYSTEYQVEHKLIMVTSRGGLEFPILKLEAQPHTKLYEDC